RGLPRLLVVKVLLPDRASDAEFLQMFFEEARLSARLDHPNCIKILGVDQECEEPYILMEYLAGASLESLVRRSRSHGGIPLNLHLKIIACAARGLHHAHE